jgi:hypothetical protein
VRFKDGAGFGQSKLGIADNFRSIFAIFQFSGDLDRVQFAPAWPEYPWVTYAFTGQLI